MTDNHWSKLPPGPQLRRIIAERLGWHMRKIPVGHEGIAYDYLIYDNNDRFIYQREAKPDELENEATIIDQTWMAAVQDDECPPWDEDLSEALDLAYGMEREIWQENGTVYAWVKSTDYPAEADTEPLAVVRAWLAATADDPAYFH